MSSEKNINFSYSQRAKEALNPTGQALLHLMDDKQTNLALSADVTRCEDLLSFADALGPQICMLKTHIDILEDFNPEFIHKLTALAEKHHFVLFEDRKFADIGSTVKKQYRDGMYRISDWADIVNAHVVPGPGVIEGLKEVGLPKKRGLLVLAQMSSQGQLATGTYTKTAVRFAEEHAEFAIGFICQEKVSNLPGMIHCTPGVNLANHGDALKQQYSTPSFVIKERSSDLIIVGRGILEASDPLERAKCYRQEAWSAYLERIS